MPAIEALSLFYDFPRPDAGRPARDEMIRKLADRLVSGSTCSTRPRRCCSTQVEHRLQGAARAQVAVRLAVIYLMAAQARTAHPGAAPEPHRRPAERAAQPAPADRGARAIGCRPAGRRAGDHRQLTGPGVERLRADVLWKARRWRDAGEQMEKMYGERWREFAPLTEPERADVMRAAIGYALGEDMIGLDRFRTKYAPKMAEGPDRRAFEVVTAPFNTNAPEFGAIARVVAATDTLEGSCATSARASRKRPAGPAPRRSRHGRPSLRRPSAAPPSRRDAPAEIKT
jgi:hypothetical protein